MERLRPTGVTQAQRDAQAAFTAERARKARIIARLREKGYEMRDDLTAIAEAVRYLYQQTGIAPPAPLVQWWKAFQEAENEIDAEETS